MFVMHVITKDNCDSFTVTVSFKDNWSVLDILLQGNFRFVKVFKLDNARLQNPKEAIDNVLKHVSKSFQGCQIVSAMSKCIHNKVKIDFQLYNIKVKLA